MAISNTILSADHLLFETASKCRLLTLARPLNEVEARVEFLAGRGNPKLIYPAPTPVEVAALERLRLPRTTLGGWLENQRRQLLAVASALSGKASLTQVSRQIYGSPGPNLEAAARCILQELPVELPNQWERLPWVRNELRAALRDCGLEQWKISVSPGNWTAARPLAQEIVVTRYGPVPAGTARRLAVHEIGVHALRAQNGFDQPLKLLGYGVPGYEATEEGLAVYSEVWTGTADARILRRYAARVLAVSALDRGLTFAENFEELVALGLTEAQSWSTVLRARRGGGLYKDHIYLEGLFKILGHLRDGGSLESLYVGKVGLQHLDELQQGLAEGWLNPPARLPWFLEQQPAPNRAWQLLQQLVA